jgi:hypothetical protein
MTDPSQTTDTGGHLNQPLPGQVTVRELITLLVGEDPNALVAWDYGGILHTVGTVVGGGPVVKLGGHSHYWPTRNSLCACGASYYAPTADTGAQPLSMEELEEISLYSGVPVIQVAAIAKLVAMKLTSPNDRSEP